MSALEQRVDTNDSAVETSAAELFRRHRRRLVAFCYAQLGGRDEAEDAVQDTFIYALHALRRGVVPESELAWLFTIARNVCHTRRRNGSRHNRVLVTRDLHALSDVLPAREQTAEELYGLEEALASIPDSQRQAILLREWRGLSYREIARELELSQAAVETLLFRARRSLSRALERSRANAARALNLPGLICLARSLFGGGAAKFGAVALTVAATSTIGATALRERGMRTPHHPDQPSIEAFAWRPDALALLHEHRPPSRTQTTPTPHGPSSQRTHVKRVPRDAPRQSVHVSAAVTDENANVPLAPPAAATTQASGPPTTTPHTSDEPGPSAPTSPPTVPPPPPSPPQASVPAAEPPSVSTPASPPDVQVQASATLPAVPATPAVTVSASASPPDVQVQASATLPPTPATPAVTVSVSVAKPSLP